MNFLFFNFSLLLRKFLKIHNNPLYYLISPALLVLQVFLKKSILLQNWSLKTIFHVNFQNCNYTVSLKKAVYCHINSSKNSFLTLDPWVLWKNLRDPLLFFYGTFEKKVVQKSIFVAILVLRKKILKINIYCSMGPSKKIP